VENDQIKTLALTAAEKHDADIYFYSGEIDDGGYGRIAEVVTTSFNADRHRAVLILVTEGGSANAGYQIARLFQKLYKEFWLFCPSRCKSAGTLIAIGAHRLIMHGFSELGPLDVQLLKEDELFARKSGLLAKATFEALGEESLRLYEWMMLNIKVKGQSTISFKLASQLAAEMSTNLLSQVYAQISPDIIGNEKRDLEVATEYGHRLESVSQNTNSHTVDHLVSHYPSHDFVIDDDEARLWFNNVDFPSEELYNLMACLGDDALGEASPTVVLALSLQDDEDEKDEQIEAGREEASARPGNGGEASMADGGDADRSGDSSPSGEIEFGQQGIKDGADKNLPTSKGRRGEHRTAAE